MNSAVKPSVDTLLISRQMVCGAFIGVRACKTLRLLSSREDCSKTFPHINCSSGNGAAKWFFQDELADDFRNNVRCMFFARAALVQPRTFHGVCTRPCICYRAPRTNNGAILFAFCCAALEFYERKWIICCVMEQLSHALVLKDELKETAPTKATRQTETTDI